MILEFILGEKNLGAAVPGLAPDTVAQQGKTVRRNCPAAWPTKQNCRSSFNSGRREMYTRQLGGKVGGKARLIPWARYVP